MAPGPMGQCFPIPEDEGIKRQMLTTAENHRKIFRMYNFDYITKVHTQASVGVASVQQNGSGMFIRPQHGILIVG